MSQQELAILCGTTQSAIARLERGGRPPKLDTLMRIADCPRRRAAARDAPARRDHRVGRTTPWE